MVHVSASWVATSQKGSISSLLAYSMPEVPFAAVQDTTVDLESLQPVLDKAFEAAGIKRKAAEQQQEQQQSPQPEQQPAEQRSEPQAEQQPEAQPGQQEPEQQAAIAA